MGSRSWVELKSSMIIARMRGSVTEAEIEAVQQQIVQLLTDTDVRRVLYDGLEMDPPTVELTLAQQGLAAEFHKRGAKIALLVPSARIAYLARIAFGAGEHRVFYDDLAAATAWLISD